MRPSLRVLSLAFALAIASNCGGTSTATPTTPTAVLSTETFTGTVDIAGRTAHSFVVGTASSPVAIDLTAAGPPSTIFMGLGVGTFANSTCTLLTNGSTVTQAGATAQLTGTVSVGTFCVMVYDAGNQSAPVTYSLTVSHY
jgi:hypothetical protein